MMWKSYIALMSVLAIGGCRCPCSGSGTSEQGFESLFNGRDLSGWTVKCKSEDRGKSFWRLDEGTILANSLGYTGHDYVWLVTDEEYQDFHLKLRFQAYRDSPGNSGVQVRSRYDDSAGWLDGPQFDINPPGPWRTGMVWDETRGASGWLYPKVPEGEWVDESMAPAEFRFYFSDDSPAWNDMEIRAVGTTFKCILNGVTVSEFDAAGRIDDPVHQKRNVGMRGHIALQIHRGAQLKIRFRDIRIRKLSP